MPGLRLRARSPRFPASLLRRSALALPGVLLAGMAGCPPSLEDPERFSRECATGAVVESLFRTRCSGSGCHGGTSDLGAGLDLESPAPLERMVGVPAEECEGELLVHPAGPSRSYIMAKVAGQPRCGDPMPIGGRRLSPSEVRCLEDWIVAGLQGRDAGALHDASGDAPAEAGTDAPRDVSGDVAPDAPSDVSGDVAPDAPEEAEHDALDAPDDGGAG